MSLEAPEPVKRVVAAIFQRKASYEDAKERLERDWGPVDVESETFAFDVSDYYEAEMGRDLKRRLLSFEHLVPPDSLPADKRFSTDVEDSLRVSGSRSVNLDSGYLDLGKFVLASTKGLSQKIYVADGIYADFVCRYVKGRFQTFDWTFPDFQDGRYEKALLAIRMRYREQIRTLRGN